MSRSFTQSMRPSIKKPSSRMSFHQIDFDRMQSFAESHFVKHMVAGEREFDLFLDPSYSLGEMDLIRLKSEIGRNHIEDPETRSTWMKLMQPFEDTVQNFVVTELQIKGIVFNEKSGTKEYRGDGWIPEIFFSNDKGEICRLEINEPSAQGKCSIIEGYFEFLLCRAAAESLKGSTKVPTAIGWGKFKENSEDSPYGFVVLGLPKLIEGREKLYLEAIDQCASTGNVDSLERIFKMRSSCMRDLHSNGILASGRHFGNFSILLENPNEGFIHDLGGAGSCLRWHLLSHEQYCAEVFCQLIYAFTPRKICVPVPSENHVARTTLMQHYDHLLGIGLKEYYQSEEVEQFTLEDLEHAFFDALEKPLQNSLADFATFHISKTKNWGRVMNKHQKDSEFLSLYLQNTVRHPGLEVGEVIS